MHGATKWSEADYDECEAVINQGWESNVALFGVFACMRCCGA
jgi:hypothetical protein